MTDEETKKRYNEVVAAIVKAVPGYPMKPGQLDFNEWAPRRPPHLEDVMLWLRGVRPDIALWWTGTRKDALCMGDRIPTADTDLEEWDVNSCWWVPGKNLLWHRENESYTIDFLHTLLR